MSVKLLPDLEDLLENLGVTGVAAIVLLPVLMPEVGKPLAKATVKGGMLLYDKSKGLLADMGKTFEEIVSEARAELDEKKAETAAEIAQAES